MITKEEFISKIKSTSNPDEFEIEELVKEWDEAYQAAVEAEKVIPDIGFLSARKKIGAFMVVGKFLDELIDQDKIDLSGSQLAMMILRLSNKKFMKCQMMFDFYSGRYTVRDVVEFPDSIKEYFAGIKYGGL